MFKKLCNVLCIRIGKKAQRRIGQVASWLAAKAGLKVVDADAVLLPKGFSMFSDELAKQVGVERAAIYQKIKGWQEYNCRQEKQSHFRHERWWTYGRPEYWFKKEFIWSSVSTIRRAFNDLEKAGLMAIDRTGGQMWLSALAGETVNLNAGSFNVQLGLFNVDSAASNWRSSIEKPSSLKQTKVKRQSNKRAGFRNDAVADFVIPEYRDQVGEIQESREGDIDGRDVLAQLPGELVTGWTDAKLPLEQLVAQHGVERINRTWAEAKNFKSQFAGLRTLLKAAPAPYPPIAPPPPAPAQAADEWQEGDHPLFKRLDGPDADTEPNGELDEVQGNETPAIDKPVDANAGQWEIAYSQLEIQLDRASFETWLRGASYSHVDHDVWVIRVANSYAQMMLQHRLYREIRRVLGDVLGYRVELRFEVAGAVAHE